MVAASPHLKNNPVSRHCAGYHNLYLRLFFGGNLIHSNYYGNRGGTWVMEYVEQGGV